MSRVLIVDDEYSIRLTLCEFLNRGGYDADQAATAEEALRMLQVKTYDIVLTDIIMPRLSGIELLARIREKNPAIQVVMMTGEPTVDTAVSAVQSGANDYLAKPIDKETLLKTIGNAAAMKHLHDEKLELEQKNREYRQSLEKMVLDRTRELQDAMQSIIMLVTSVVEMRDPYTAGHQRKVGNLAAALAEKMAFDRDFINRVRIIGYIHDLGKIIVPSEILNKPGRLTDLEFALIRNHPTQGFDMLNRVSIPGRIAEAVYQHHERCDGSGYPRGIIEQEIMPESHVLIVADVVEAMMSHRPYRPAMGLSAALDEIRANVGKLYNPDVAQACLDLFEQDGYLLDEKERPISFTV